MRQSGSGVVADYRLPPDAPEEVRAAQERYEHVASRWADLMGRIDDAKAVLEAAKAADHEEAVEAALSGSELDERKLGARERKARVYWPKMACRRSPPVRPANQRCDFTRTLLPIAA